MIYFKSLYVINGCKLLHATELNTKNNQKRLRPIELQNYIYK